MEDLEGAHEKKKEKKIIKKMHRGKSVRTRGTSAGTPDQRTALLAETSYCTRESTQ